MLSEVQKTKCKQILDHYGVENQRSILVEEIGELLQAISKLNRYGDVENYISELADVRIMVAQMILSLDEVQQIYFDEIVNYKLDRQLKRIGGEK